MGDISGPEVSVATIDATNHDSPDAFAEFLPGMAEAGDVQFECFFDPNHVVHERLRELAELRLPADMALLMPVLSTGEFIANPAFVGWDSGTSTMTDWLYAPSWSPTEGYVDYSSSNPGASESIRTDVSNLLAGENYTLAITFTGEDATDFDIQITLAGAVIGTVNPSGGGTQKLIFTLPELTSGELALTVPESIGSGVSFVVGRVSLTGPTANADQRFDFTGLVTAVGIMAPVKDALKAPVSIKVSGKPVYTRVD